AFATTQNLAQIVLPVKCASTLENFFVELYTAQPSANGYNYDNLNITLKNRTSGEQQDFGIPAGTPAGVWVKPYQYYDITYNAGDVMSLICSMGGGASGASAQIGSIGIMLKQKG